MQAPVGYIATQQGGCNTEKTAVSHIKERRVLMEIGGHAPPPRYLFPYLALSCRASGLWSITFP